MNELHMYEIDPKYLEYLHNVDPKVSIKFSSRPFVGLIVTINNQLYAIPLTSQTTEKRAANGKKKRSSRVTTFIRDSRGNEISNILHNNMIPVAEGTYSLKEIDPHRDTYEMNEIRFIRKNKENIVKKAKAVHKQRIEGKDSFLKSVCCDFELLETRSKEYHQD